MASVEFQSEPLADDRSIFHLSGLLGSPAPLRRLCASMISSMSKLYHTSVEFDRLCVRILVDVFQKHR